MNICPDILHLHLKMFQTSCDFLLCWHYCRWGTCAGLPRQDFPNCFHRWRRCRSTGNHLQSTEGSHWKLDRRKKRWKKVHHGKMINPSWFSLTRPCSCCDQPVQKPTNQIKQWEMKGEYGAVCQRSQLCQPSSALTASSSAHLLGSSIVLNCLVTWHLWIKMDWLWIKGDRSTACC